MKQGAFLPEAMPLERRRAELRRKAERRRLLAEPCDVGLFGTDRDQLDLVERVRTLAEVWADEDRAEAERRAAEKPRKRKTR